jgi:putative Mg2+ transporter-C (MgtC) family protein
MPSHGELALRLLVAAGLAGVLGFEREMTDQPAGFRTHILVGLGAALFTVLSAYGFRSVPTIGPAQQVTQDPTRIAAQIVVGIGFLGGGAIIKYGATVRGLTTAASLWVTAAIGTAAGIGEFALASTAVGIALVAVVGLRPLRRAIRRYGQGQHELILETDRHADLVQIMGAIQKTDAAVHSVSVSEDEEEREVRLLVRLPPRSSVTKIAEAVSNIPHVRNVNWRD